MPLSAYELLILLARTPRSRLPASNRGLRQERAEPEMAHEEPSVTRPRRPEVCSGEVACERTVRSERAGAAFASSGAGQPRGPTIERERGVRAEE